MADPTPYDILQDAAIEGLQEIVTPYYTPPGDVEYSFPVVGQGITADQYRLMSLTQGDGIIHRGVRPYYLEGHPTDAETNTRNTLILKVDGQTGYSESIIGGFYHRLNQDMEISFPPVTTPTDYHVCVTYDPRKENEPTGPVSIETYAGEPPRTQGRMHIILNVVQREPNQLLSQATIQRYRQFVSPTIAVQNAGQLPDPADVLRGTTAFAGRSGTPFFDLYRNTTSGGWQNMLIGEWEDLLVRTANHWHPRSHSARPQIRHSAGNRIELRGLVTNTTSMTGMNGVILSVPSYARPSRTMEFECARTPNANFGRIQVHPDGNVELGYTSNSYYTWISFDGITYSTD